MKFTIVIVFCLGVGAFAATKADISWRIVGGKQASDGQFPYQVSIRNRYRHMCGGSILDEHTILTAAHCVYGVGSIYLDVVTGTNKLDSPGDVYDVGRYTYHEYWDPTNIKNDIALLRIFAPIKFNDKVRPIQLREKEMPGDATCTLSGWGRTNASTGDIPNDLQFISLRSLSVKECQEKQTDRPVGESEICTLTVAGEGACHGDSGGPLVDSEGKQIGIVSWGTPCATGRPDVFTRVGSFIDWINANRG